jgi:HEPN domain-containing protein
MNEKIRYWIELAEYDLETAKVMLEGRRFLYVGFMCHQTIEKALKGYYVSAKNETPPYTHNLTFLAKDAGLYEKMAEQQKDFIDLIKGSSCRRWVMTVARRSFATPRNCTDG